MAFLLRLPLNGPPISARFSHVEKANAWHRVGIPVIRDGNLICACGKKDLSPWVQQFVAMIEASLARVEARRGKRPSES